MDLLDEMYKIESEFGQEEDFLDCMTKEEKQNYYWMYEASDKIPFLEFLFWRERKKVKELEEFIDDLVGRTRRIIR